MHRATLARWVGSALVALAPLLPCTGTAQAPFPADADLQVMLRYLVEDGATPGIVFGIVDGGGAPRILSHGTGGPGARPLGAGSVFEIGSITKTFTGALLADMVARGEVALEDPVSKYLPAGVVVPSRGGREITLLDLATHRSGLPGLPDNVLPGDLSNPYADYTIEALYAFLSGHELRRAPGAEAEYSNLGFGLLGHALARAAGTTYRGLLRERILDPLGMDATGHVVRGEATGALTRGHKHGRVVGHWSTTEAFDGAGGLYSSMADMLKYLAANVGPPRTDLERAMRDAHRPRGPFDERSEIGLGWRTERYDGATVVEHGGVSGGYSARIGFDPERGVGFVRLTNTTAFPDNLGLHFLVNGPPPEVAEVDVPGDLLHRYVGTYELAPGTHFFIRLEDDGTLTAQGGRNTVRFRMYADSDSSFVVKRVPARLAFPTGASGEVEAMALGSRTLRRVSDDTPPPGLPRREVRDLPLTVTDIARYEGTYRVGAGEQTIEARIYGEEGELMARIIGGAVSRLLHQGEHTFLVDADTDMRVVFTVDGDRARGLTLHQRGTAVPGVRTGDP